MAHRSSMDMHRLEFVRITSAENEREGCARLGKVEILPHHTWSSSFCFFPASNTTDFSPLPLHCLLVVGGWLTNRCRQADGGLFWKAT